MDEREWTDRPIAVGEVLDVAGARITRVEIAAARLVSGPLEAALAALAPEANVVGLAEDAGQGDAALRIARDRALLVSHGPRDWPEGWQAGWQAGGFALSRAGDLYAALEISGPGAPDVLAQIGAVVSGRGSPSCAIRIAGGHTALIVRRGAAWWLLVELSVLTEVTSFLRGCVAVNADAELGDDGPVQT